jgi:DNA-binding transcriptional LysR family regulator
MLPVSCRRRPFPVPGRDYSGVVVDGPKQWINLEVWGTGAAMSDLPETARMRRTSRSLSRAWFASPKRSRTNRPLLKFPDVQVHLILSDSGLDIIDDGLDVALRIGLPADSNVITKKILSAKRIVCASPAYLKKHGVPEKPGGHMDLPGPR